MSKPKPVLFIDLWPRESECVLCDRDLVGCTQGLPMYEGEVVAVDYDGEWAGFDVCEECFLIHRPKTRPPSTLGAENQPLTGRG